MFEQKKPQTLEESANWISYNLKRIADMLEKMNGIERPSHNKENRNSNGGNSQQNSNNYKPF